MAEEIVIKVDNVSKKFCKTTKNSMAYAMLDIGRNLLGLGSNPGTLRKNEFWALDNVSFEVKRGETLGLIGPNGSGKTTLLKMLNGLFWPDKGNISIKGRVGALIAVGAGFHPLLTGRENIYVNAAILGMNRKEVDKKFDAIVDFADIGDFLDSPVKHYSSGMVVRLGFAIAVHCEPDILLVDEVLAVGDEGFQKKSYNKIGELRNNGTTTILVSHNMHAITSFAQKAILIYQGEGKYSQDVQEAIGYYEDLFTKKDEGGLEKVVMGNEEINFLNINVIKHELRPGDDFEVILSYNSVVDFEDVEIDLKITEINGEKPYFLASNRAYGKNVTLGNGMHSLRVGIKNIPLNGTLSKIAISIWTKNREKLIFWCRAPIKFMRNSLVSGQNYLPAVFEVK